MAASRHGDWSSWELTSQTTGSRDHDLETAGGLKLQSPVTHFFLQGCTFKSSRNSVANCRLIIQMLESEGICHSNHHTLVKREGFHLYSYIYSLIFLFLVTCIQKGGVFTYKVLPATKTHICAGCFTLGISERTLAVRSQIPVSNLMEDN